MPLNDSLVVESLRAIDHDISGMIKAAQRCADVERIASESQPSDKRVGGCRNVLLDDIMIDFAAGYKT